jgi:hypothetical protein
VGGEGGGRGWRRTIEVPTSFWIGLVTFLIHGLGQIAGETCSQDRLIYTHTHKGIYIYI